MSPQARHVCRSPSEPIVANMTRGGFAIDCESLQTAYPAPDSYYCCETRSQIMKTNVRNGFGGDSA